MVTDDAAPSEPADRETSEMEVRRIRNALIRAEGERIAAYLSRHPDAARELASYTAWAEDFES